MRIDFELSGNGRVYLFRPVSRRRSIVTVACTRRRRSRATRTGVCTASGTAHFCMFRSPRLNSAFEVGTLVIADNSRLVPLNGCQP